MNNRVKKTLKALESYNCEALLVYGAYNRRYLSEFTGSSGYLFITNNRCILLTDFRYMEQSSQQCKGYDIIDFTKKGLMETILELIEEEQVKTLGFEPKNVTYDQYKTLSEAVTIDLVEVDGLVEKIRMIKDTEELEAIAKAEAIGDAAFTHILSFIKEGVTEIELALEIEYFMRRNGASNNSFDPIVASGARASLPHATPTNTKIKNGQVVLMDFGCIYNGYCSDMTRTVFLGKADDKFKHMYKAVLDAQLASLEALKAGVIGKEIDKIARDIIDVRGYNGKFGHGLGHCVGLEIHEGPRLSPLSETVFEENMVVTVEPGIYIPNFAGVRIEDVVCVKQDGIVNYTSSPKELIEL